jgi:hypothetical protein
MDQKKKGKVSPSIASTDLEFRDKSLLPKRPIIHKVARACVACCKRKKRCSGEHPCEYCAKRGLPCTYDTDSSRRVRKLAKLQHMFEKVVEDPSGTVDESDSDWQSPITRLSTKFNSVNMDSPRIDTTGRFPFAMIPEVFGTLATPGFNFDSLSTQLLQSFNGTGDLPMFNPVPSEEQPSDAVKAAARAAVQQLMLGPMPTPGDGLQNGGISYFDSLFQDDAETSTSLADSPYGSDQSTIHSTTLPGQQAFYDNLSVDDAWNASLGGHMRIPTESDVSDISPDTAEPLPMFKFFPDLLVTDDKPDVCVEMALLVTYFTYIYPLIVRCLLERLTFCSQFCTEHPLSREKPTQNHGIRDLGHCCWPACSARLRVFIPISKSSARTISSKQKSWPIENSMIRIWKRYSPFCT